MKIKLTKISDDKFGGNHPNGINEGNVYEGIELVPLQVGYSYGISSLQTSTVEEIIDENTFRTRNSTYKREVIE